MEIVKEWVLKASEKSSETSAGRHLSFGRTGCVGGRLQLSQLEPSTVLAAFVLSGEILESGA